MKRIILAALLSYSVTSFAGVVASPTGFIEFCDKGVNAEICVKSNQETTVGSLDDLKRINRTVNSSISFVDDNVAGRGIDNWQIPTDGTGDCEDYVLTKASKLIESGWNANQLQVGILKYRGTYHAVLVATTSEGKSYFLDNNNNEVKSVNGFPGNGMRWDRIQVKGSTEFQEFNGNI